MAEPVKRARYFDHQLIRANDLTLDQAYHRRMRELQNRLMYRWGIGEGLQVVAAGADAVTVGPGVAFDRDGHQILLADPVTLELADLQLAAAAPAWVTIAWREEPTDVSDDGVGEPTRWTELPDVTVAAAPPADPGHGVVLAKVVRAGGAVTGIDGTDRRLIGLPEAQELRADIARRILRDGPETMAGPLQIDRELRLGGSRLSGDPAGLLSIAAQKTQLSGSLSLGGDLLAPTVTASAGVTASGVSVGRDPGGGIDYPYEYESVGVANTAYNLRLQSPNSILVHTGGAQRMGVDATGSLSIYGNPANFTRLTVGAGSNGAIKVRHINGKRPDNDGNDPLYLNWDTGQHVQVGGGVRADLHVAGSIFADGGLLFATKITTDTDGRIGCAGWSPTPRTDGWGGGIHTWDIEVEGTGWSRGGWESGPRDIAERFASDEHLEPGDVVSLDCERDVVILARQARDPLVLGVISNAPGMLLGVDPDAGEEDAVVPVGLAGRVPCKVLGPVARGDLLTAASEPGRAMRADADPPPGTIIGKALEPCTDERATIDIILLSR